MDNQEQDRPYKPDPPVEFGESGRKLWSYLIEEELITPRNKVIAALLCQAYDEFMKELEEAKNAPLIFRPKMGRHLLYPIFRLLKTSLSEVIKLSLALGVKERRDRPPKPSLAEKLFKLPVDTSKEKK